MKSTEARIDSPCQEDWNQMTGDDARRFCGTCAKHVHNLSAMTEAEARSVVARKNVCVRYSLQSGGRSIRHRTSRRMMLRAAAAATLTAGLALPAVASISTEPGEVGLLQTAWKALTDWTSTDDGIVQGGITALPDDDPEAPVMGALAPRAPAGPPSDAAQPGSDAVEGGVAPGPVPQQVRMGRVRSRGPRSTRG